MMSEIGMNEAESKAKLIKLRKVSSNKDRGSSIDKHFSHA
jgi:hypothetical protein